LVISRFTKIFQKIEILKFQNKTAEIGQRVRLSEGDILKINRMYGCPEPPTPEPTPEPTTEAPTEKPPKSPKEKVLEALGDFIKEILKGILGKGRE
jgi:hypothetical protein